MEDTVDLMLDSFFSLRERTAASQPSANISMDASLLLGNGPGYLNSDSDTSAPLVFAL